jgi:hypothetical protein
VLRSALGPALRRMGAEAVFWAVHGGEGVAAFWLVGWDSPRGPVSREGRGGVPGGAGGVLAGAGGSPGAALPERVGRGLVGSRRLRLCWLPEGRGEAGFGPALPEPELELVGLRGVMAYEGLSPLALLRLGAELGVGKDTAFGCGAVRLFRAL